MLFAAAAFAVACGGKAAPEQPAPEPTPTAAPEPAPAPADDSAERDRLEKERMAREAAERMRAVVAADLAAMINFDYDQAVVRSADQATLDRKAAILVANPGGQAPDQRPRRRARLGRVQSGAGQPPRGRGQAVPGEQGRGCLPDGSHLLRRGEAAQPGERRDGVRPEPA